MLAAQATPVPPAASVESLLACLRANITPSELTTTATAILDNARRPGTSMPPLGRMLQRCGHDGADGAMPVMLGFGMMLTAEQRVILATRAGLSPEQRVAFEAVLHPIADGLEVNRNGASFGPGDISDATLAVIRRDVAAAGAPVSMTDRVLRQYIEWMARDLAMAGNLDRMLTAR